MYKVGCWGAGTYAKESVAQMISEGITIEFFVDSDNKKSGGEFLGYPIISPVDFLRGGVKSFQVLIHWLSQQDIGRVFLSNVSKWGFRTAKSNTGVTKVRGCLPLRKCI